MNCKKCSEQIEYFPHEKKAWQRFNVPLPSTCSDCRRTRKLIFRNERNLYYNKSAKSGRQMISVYSPETPFQIIDMDEWWDDSNDSTIYGQDFDFSRPFFEQFKELQLKVPRWSRMTLNCENSDFTNNCAEVNNSYLTFSSHSSENLYYCMRVYRSKNCIDCVNMSDCEYCSQSVDCKKCYNTHYSQLAENCSDSYFLFDCRSCQNCILCAGIRNGSYMILNKKYSPAEYEKFKEEFLQELSSNPEKILKSFEDLKKQVPHKNIHISSSEKVTGDFIQDSKNIYNSFYSSRCEDCINLYNCDELKDCYDNLCNDKSELCLECDTAYDLYNCQFCTYTVSTKNSQYCDQCFYLENCFGCVGLSREKYVILNKRYSASQYAKLIEKIEEHMKRTGEYGKPFPGNLSSFAYNETLANDFHPLTKEQALSQGYKWYEEKEEAKHFGKKYEIPQNWEEIDKSICDKILQCEITGKNYKIIPQEYDFYKKFRLPIPKRCPDQRYKDLYALKPPLKIRKTHCNSCNKSINTSYPQQSEYQILCEQCYLKTVY